MSHNTIKPLAKNQEKYDKVRSLRRSGMSHCDIAKEVGVYKRQVGDWTWDIVLTEEQKEDIDERGRIKNSQYHKELIGDKNPNYRYDEVGYDAIHKWIYKHKPRSNVCEYCKRPNLQLVCACVGEYKRDLDQFKWLCLELSM